MTYNKIVLTYENYTMTYTCTCENVWFIMDKATNSGCSATDYTSATHLSTILDFVTDSTPKSIVAYHGSESTNFDILDLITFVANYYAHENI